MINKLNIAIAGLGTVGSSTINLIEKNKNIFKVEPIVFGMPDTPTPTSVSLTKNY